MDVGLAGGQQAAAAFVVVSRGDLFEQHAGELAALVGEFLGHEEVEDRDVLVHRVLLLPGRRLHLLEAGTDDDLDVGAAEPAGGPAAVHRGVAAAEDDDALADLGGVAEGHAGEPVDADVDIGGRLLAAGNVEVAPARRARADEDRVIALLDQLFHAVDFHTAPEFDAEIEDVAHFLVDHFHRQAEARDLRPDHPAGPRILVENRDVIAERGEIARDGE